MGPRSRGIENRSGPADLLAAQADTWTARTDSLSAAALAGSSRQKAERAAPGPQTRVQLESAR